MNIYVINKSSVLTDQEIQSWIPAFNKFVSHVREYWPRPATVIWCDRSKEPSLAWKLIFADTSDTAGALGYHDYTPDGRPVSYVFAADDKRFGYSPTVTATHELAEMVADPWISEAFQVSNTQFYAKEICDPCETDAQGFNIAIPGFPVVACSDFVLPHWFIPGSSGKYDYMGRISRPLMLLAGGYMSVYSGGSWTQIYAQTHGMGRKVTKDVEKDNKYGRLVKYGRNRGSAVKF